MRQVMFAATLSTCLMALPALADPWKDESGHGWRGGEHKEEYWDGRCKIERKWEKDGDYKEERKCDRPVVIPPGPVYAPAPVFADLPPPPPGRDYGPVYQASDGGYCREYQGVAIIDGRQQRIYGTACLEPDGSWAVAH